LIISIISTLRLLLLTLLLTLLNLLNLLKLLSLLRKLLTLLHKLLLSLRLRNLGAIRIAVNRSIGVLRSGSRNLWNIQRGL
jgi:hypothetical protein